MAQVRVGDVEAVHALVGAHPEVAGAVVGDAGAKPVDDPAVAVGLALRYERIARTGKIAFPKSVTRLVEAGAASGDEACRMMLERLRRRGWAARPNQDGDPDASSRRPS